MIELTEIMQQKDDQHFTEPLNRFRTGSQTDKDVNCINSRLIFPSADNYSVDALHIWSENDPVNEYNNKRLEQLSLPLSILKATINTHHKLHKGISIQCCPRQDLIQEDSSLNSRLKVPE